MIVRCVREACLRWARLALIAFAMRSGLRGDVRGPLDGDMWWREWEFDPATVVLLFVGVALYAAGLRCLRLATGKPAKLRRPAVCFAAGWLVLVLALLSPLHPWSSVWFFVHMTQHELLMVVAAPLLVLGRPALVMLWAFPRRVAGAALAASRRAGLGHLWRCSTNVFVASLVHAIVLWAWHVPQFFEATLASDAVHALQHGTFLGTALMFWQAVLFGERRAADYGLAVLYLFLTAMHSGALGALITFASSPWYGTYAAALEERPFTPLEDQQLGGLIMWIPAGMVYVVAGLVLFAAWLRDSERRAQTSRRETRCAPAV